MPKRKQGKDRDEDGQVSSDDDTALVTIDFDFFDPNPRVDYLALKRLLNQLFAHDAELFRVAELVELVLGQPLVGTTIKTASEGLEGDPLAMCTVLNMRVHQAKEAIKALREYVLIKSSDNPELHAALQSLLAHPCGVVGNEMKGGDNSASKGEVGLVFSERLVNMPVQVVPHMFRMLGDEMRMAVEDNEPYTFSHYLILTRTYRLTPEQAAEYGHPEAPAPPPSKKAKSKTGGHPTLANTATNGGLSTYSFHPEDEIIQKYASFTHDYSLTKQAERQADSFGLDVAGRMMLIPAENFQAMMEEMAETFAVQQ